MNEAGKVAVFSRKLKARNLRFLIALALLKALAVFLIFTAICAAMDAAFALPLSTRGILRWFTYAASLALFARSLYVRRGELRTEVVIKKVEAHFSMVERHDPLSNAWSFLNEQGGSETQAELIAKEIARAAGFVKKIKKRLSEIYGVRALFKSVGTYSLAAFLISPAAVVGSAVLSDSSAASVLQRLFNPYGQLAHVFKNIQLDPSPGSYRPAMGSPQTIRISLSGARPQGWGEPKVELEGEEYAMAQVSSDGGGSYQYTAASLVKPIRLRIIWGEYISPAWYFDPASLPEIEEIVFQSQPPAYAASKGKTWTNPSSISVLQGSVLKIDGRSKTALRSVEVFWDSDRAHSPAAAPQAQGKKFSFSVTPQSGAPLKLRLTLTDETGLKNTEAWAVPMEVVPDAPPIVSITDPAFTEVQMDLEGELPVSWEASDDIRLMEITVVGGLQGQSVGQKRSIWKADKEVDHAGEMWMFKPRQWQLRNGDKLVLFLEAKDNNPGNPAPARSAESLLIAVTDFTGQHQANLEQGDQSLKEDMMAHLEEGLALQEEMESKKEGTQEKLAQYDAKSRELTRKMRERAKALENDPMASPKWSWGMKQLAQNLDQARAPNISPDNMDRYMQELEKAASVFQELKKEQKMTDAVNVSQRLEDLTDRLSQNLEEARGIEELQDILSDLDKEFQALSEALSKMNPDEYPQEFVNQAQPEDMPVGEVAQAKKDLAEALRSGDMKAAKEAVKKMLEDIKKMRKQLEESAENYRKKPQDLLGNSKSGEKKEEGKKDTIADDVQKIRKGQEDLLWKTSAIEQEMKKRGAKSSLNDEENKNLKEQAGEQEKLLQSTKKALSEMAKIDQDFPTMMLSPLTSKLEAAGIAQEEAAKAMKEGDLGKALPSQNAALKKLNELMDGMDQLSQQMASMPGSQGSGGSGGRPLMMIPGSGSSRESGGTQGANTGPVKIPRRQDYQVPAQERQEILKSMQERAPKSMEKEVGDYLKSLLK